MIYVAHASEEGVLISDVGIPIPWILIGRENDGARADGYRSPGDVDIERVPVT